MLPPVARGALAWAAGQLDDVGVDEVRHGQNGGAGDVCNGYLEGLVGQFPTARYSASQRYRRPRLELAGRALGFGQMQALASAAKSFRAPVTISASTFGSA